LLTPLALFDVAERDANHYCCASHKTGTMKPVHVIGGGLAGSEAAWQLARAGVPVVLHEMRPERGTDAHQTDGLAELVCSNSFRSDDSESNARRRREPSREREGRRSKQRPNPGARNRCRK